MSRNATGFKWSSNKRQAVELVAHDLLTDVEIAKQLGINKKTLERWKKEPVFSEAVNEVKVSIASALRAQGIAVRQNRIDALNERWRALEQIREERAADAVIGAAPGGKTGFVAVSLKSVRVTMKTDDGASVSSRETWEHSFDRAFFSAYQEVEKQMAQETGQWVEKSERTTELTNKIELIGIDEGDI